MAPLAKARAQAQVALMLLTRLPAGTLAQGHAVPNLGQSLWAFPLVGALVGAIGAGALALAMGAGLPAHIAAALAVIAALFATGGLHEDGLADLADGFGGGRDAAHKLAIMKDSRIGSYGTLALIAALGLRVAVLGHLAAVDLAGAALALVAMEAGSRAGLAALLYAMPPARKDGLGQAAASGTRGQGAGAALALGGAVLALTLGDAVLVAAMVLAMGAAQGAVAALALRQIGGQTGDVLGAAQQGAMLAGGLALLVAKGG